jgi:hypothetical protein
VLSWGIAGCISFDWGKSCQRHVRCKEDFGVKDLMRKERYRKTRVIYQFWLVISRRPGKVNAFFWLLKATVCKCCASREFQQHELVKKISASLSSI